MYLGFFGFLLACESNQQNQKIQTAKMETTENPLDEISTTGGFALVELFTSEGCSSCPSADAVASEIAQMADEKGTPVYVLPYHVDYWNYLGWKDRFSSEQFTKRQYWYAERFQSNQVYTPQMIVNGQSEFTGSKKTMASEEIQAALQKTAQSALKLHLKEDLSYHIASDNIPEHWALYYALVEKELSSQVSAGENRGRKLYHYSVVKSLYTLSNPQEKGKLDIKLTEKEGKFNVIAFIQDQKTAEILAAAQITLNL